MRQTLHKNIDEGSDRNTFNQGLYTVITVYVIVEAISITALIYHWLTK
jgi:hypothetical protein